MSPKEKAGLQAAVFRNTALDAGWMGYWLARHQQSEDLDEQQLALKLGLTMDNLVLLCLCRTPRADHFSEDLKVICRRTGASEVALAQLLRQEQALSRWKQSGSPATQGWLMAASDRPPDAGEPPPTSEKLHDQ